MAKDPYTDDEYDDTYREVHGDEPARDQYTDRTTDDTFFPFGAGGSMFRSGRGLWPGGTTTEPEYDETSPDASAVTGDESEDDSWWDEGLIGTVLVVGVVLFLFPEPATSALGIGLIAVGLIAGLVDWLS